MILKKPYAFLIKHFRIIHAFLLVFASYLIYRSQNIASSFDRYINNKQRITSIINDLDGIVNVMMYIIIALTIIIISAVIYLLKYKKKPIIFYISTIGIYIIVLISYIYASTFFESLRFETPDLRIVNILKDVYHVIVLVQIPIIVLFFIRMVGFDVRKFDFKKDLLDLGVDEKDNEEYEVSFELDRDTIQSFVKKSIRMSKYFYKENGLIFRIIEIVLAVLILTFVIGIISSREVIYKEGQTFETNYYNAKVVETYKTYNDSSGNKISNSFFYVIAKIKYNNITSNAYTINTNNIMLSYGEESVKPTSEFNNKITEFGVNYNGQVLNPYETREFVFVFEVPKEYYESNLLIKYLYNIKFKKNSSESEYEYRKIKVVPKKIDNNKETISTKSLGEELSFNGSLLGDTTIKINDIKMNDTFFYNVTKCIGKTCDSKLNTITSRQTTQFDLTLMRINFNLKFDRDKLSEYYNNSKFIEQYGSIRFEIDGKEYNNRLSLVDVTPIKTNDYVFIEIRDKVKNADKIYMDFTIRDKVFTYILKDNKKEETKAE